MIRYVVWSGIKGFDRWCGVMPYLLANFSFMFLNLSWSFFLKIFKAEAMPNNSNFQIFITLVPWPIQH